MARVLVIDDSPSIVQFLTQEFARVDIRVEHLTMFIQLPKILRTNPPDAIVLDIQMPGLNGIRIGTLIKDYQKSPIPILVFSSLSDVDREQATRTIGATEHFSKQSGSADLIKHVQDCVTLNRATR